MKGEIRKGNCDFGFTETEFSNKDFTWMMKVERGLANERMEELTSFFVFAVAGSNVVVRDFYPRLSRSSLFLACVFWRGMRRNGKWAKNGRRTEGSLRSRFSINRGGNVRFGTHLLALWVLKSLANYTRRKAVNYVNFITTLDNEKDIWEEKNIHMQGNIEKKITPLQRI